MSKTSLCQISGTRGLGLPHYTSLQIVKSLMSSGISEITTPVEVVRMEVTRTFIWSLNCCHGSVV